MTNPRTLGSLLTLVLLTASTGCTALGERSPDGERTAAAGSGVVSENALVPNALVPNALVPNALVPNALVPNALVPNALGQGAITALMDPGPGGDLSREFIRYAVGCALTPQQSFSFSWTDTQNVVHDETYDGILGIAPGWATGPLDQLGQQMISACLGARTNYYGTVVIISLRSIQSPLTPLLGDPELTDYPHVEGAFWGNLFDATTPHLSSCYTTADVANSRAALRECAAGHLDAMGRMEPCGIITIIGACEDNCTPIDGAGYYPGCIDPTWGTTQDVITTALP